MVILPVFNNSWSLVFHHEYDAGLFRSKRDALFSTKKGRFSVLGKINENFKVNGKFEFLLEYPPFSGYNQWYQTINPIHAKPNEENGYEEISCTWKVNEWHGLSLSNNTFCLIDGSPFGDTFFTRLDSFTKMIFTNFLVQDGN